MNNSNNYKKENMSELLEFDDVLEGINSVLILNDTNGKLLKVNQKAIELLGYSKNSLLEMNLKDFEKDFNQFHFEKRITALMQEKQYTYNTTLISNTGKYLEVECDSKLLYNNGQTIVFNFIKDNSTIEENEKVLNLSLKYIDEQKVFLETIFNKVPNVLFTFDNHLKLQRINKEGKSYFGLEENDGNLWGLSLDQLFYPSNKTEIPPNSILLKCIENTINKKFEYDKEELSICVNKNGALVYKTCLFSTTLLKQNGCTVYLATLEDITERKQLEVTLLESIEITEASNRLKTAFLQNISHQIRTPLNGMLGFISLLEEMKTALTVKKQLQFASIIKKSSHRLLQTITDIVNASKLDSKTYTLSKNNVLITDVMSSVLNEVTTLPQNNSIDFSYQIDDSLVGELIETDAHELSMVLLQLISNAFKYTLNGTVQLIVENTADGIEFKVKDTGIGIHPKDLTVIFEPFSQLQYTEQNAIDGNGLGLTLSKAIVTLLGGELKVSSELNEGSTFFFKLPKCGTHENLTLNNKPTVVVVSDDILTFEYIKELIELEVFTTYYAADIFELDSLIIKHPSINYILFSLNNHFNLNLTEIEAYKQQLPCVKLIGITDYPTYMYSNIDEQYGFNDIITAPFTKKQLHGILKLNKE